MSASSRDRFSWAARRRNPDAASGNTCDTLNWPFALKATEVTQAEWAAVMGSNPSHFNQCGPDCPVETVSFRDAVAFLNRLSDAAGLRRCYDDWDRLTGLGCTGFRLPTEAEWEYAARAGGSSEFHTGGIAHALNDCFPLDPSLDAAGWYCGNAEAVDCRDVFGGGRCLGPRPVALKSPNAWGLYDMHGNVFEWVGDAFAPYPEGDAEDPTGPIGGELRIVRGGAWVTFAHMARVAFRGGLNPAQTADNVGLRPARTLR
jgi:formylglycine-generating enzyme required for sulfatase activity